MAAVIRNCNAKTTMKTARNGFTLIEVLVALAILAISLGTIMAGLTLQTRRIAAAAQQSEALQIATSLLASVGASVPLHTGNTFGAMADGFAWQIRIANWGADDDNKTRTIHAYEVDVTVARHGHSVALSTLRTGA